MLSVWITGDTHGDFKRLTAEAFPQQNGMGREDYVLICGDFGGVWNGEPQDSAVLDALEAKPFTTLFICGNHENYDELLTYPVTEWHGGQVHRIREHVLHLMRGQIFEIDGHTFFTMGGARSVDIWDGLLDPEEPDFEKKYWELQQRNAFFRVKHLNWWEQELPAAEEIAEARRNLKFVDSRVDFMITHCAPDSIQSIITGGYARSDVLTRFLEELKDTVDFRYWFFGHYHREAVVQKRFILLYERVLPLL